MPELPQVQALAERVEDAFGGGTLLRSVALQFSALKTFAPGPETLEGRTLHRTGRRGKFLILELGGPRVLLHLSQGGRVDLEPKPKTTRPKGAVVRFVLDRGAILLREWGTERKAGWWVLAEGDDGPLSTLGPEPDDDAFAEYVRRGGDTRRVHTILRDQHTVAGIGRGYSDDVLWRAKLSPYASLASLDDGQRERLLTTIRDVLDEGLALERGRTGGLSENTLGGHFRIHGRWGTPCPDCGGDLRRVSYESHEVTYCPACQTGGKVLADRRMSRLIR